MSDFELIYQAAKKRDAKTISLLLLHRSSFFEPVKDFALTPAGLCAQEGDWETVNWLVTEFKASLGPILYGAVLGGHITEWAKPKEIVNKLLQGSFKGEYFWECKAYLLQAFAQMGMLDLLQQYFQDKPDKISGAMLCAAIYGKQTAVINFIFEKLGPRPGVLLEAIKGAAWANNQELLVQYLKHYNQIKKLAADELDWDAAESLMHGCGSGGHIELFAYLMQQYPDLSTRTCMFYGFKSAVYHQKEDFIISLCKQYPKAVEDAKNALATMGRPELIEQLPECPNQYCGIAIFSSDNWFSDRAAATSFLSKFNQSETVHKLCLELKRQNKIKHPVLEDLSSIQADALKIIALKNRYDLTTREAKFLFEHPKVFELMLTPKYQGKEKALFELVAEDTVLDFWQFEHLIQRLPRAQLIHDLDEYLKNKTDWWYNHRKRCESFLKAIRETKDLKQCQQLVAAQIKLFDSKTSVNTESQGLFYTSTVKQNTIKDGYYKALIRFQQYQGPEEDHDEAYFIRHKV